ncbi:MAG: hypothetical protein ACO1N6_09890 [Microcella sp.]
MMEFLDLIPILFGSALTLAGVGISELGQSRRAARAERAMERSREEVRRAELWQISLAPATRIRDSFAMVARAATPEDPWGPEEDPWDEEKFDSWWYSEEQQVSRDIALIPSIELRKDLALVAKGVSYSWALVAKVGYRANQQEAAADLGRLGFDLISSWMRDERGPEADLKNAIVDLEAQLVEVHRILTAELEA